jgi:AcrR family transcriptional regulator
MAAMTLDRRKSPRQARSLATIEALHLATIQVLERDGLGRCTTTRIAERAGVSVGSIYQYYPNRDALLAAVLEQHLNGVATAVATACREQRSKPLRQMVSGLVSAFLAAKLRDPRQSKALYSVAGERGGFELAARANAAIVRSIAEMLSTAPDAFFDDPEAVATITISSIVGTVRIHLEGNSPQGFEGMLEDELVISALAYLQVRGTPVGACSPHTDP